MRTIISLLLLLIISFGLNGQETRLMFQNPILPGFNPDPSICRVGDDYYMVTSSFTWYPGIPVYHSKDLVNWEIIGHAIDRPGMIDMRHLNDNDGIWAVTMRYYNGTYYLITTASKSGGNFYITAKDPRGPWSDPVWLKDATGIDPSLFWDDDGKCYYIGNSWNFKKSWPSQCAVWMQELDLEKKRLVGERRILTYGHANNATYAEGPHLYKIAGRYMLLMAEGGAGYYHAVTVHHSNALWGPYVADKVNPVLTHRHLGRNYPIQNLGHADLVQTSKGEWYAVALGVRNIGEYNPLARETFLAKVEFEDGTPIFNPGYGIMRAEQERPLLPWTPVKPVSATDGFSRERLDARWHCIRVPAQEFHSLKDGRLEVLLLPEVIDSLTCSAMLIQRIRHHQFMATTLLEFRTNKNNEYAGLVLYRTANGYYTLMKGKDNITLTKKHLGKKEVVCRLPYAWRQVYMKVEADGMKATFSFGKTPETMTVIGGIQSLEAISDNCFNKFNGPGIGVYATANGKLSNKVALYDFFSYKGIDNIDAKFRNE